MNLVSYEFITHDIWTVKNLPILDGVFPEYLLFEKPPLYVIDDKVWVVVVSNNTYFRQETNVEIKRSEK